MADDEHYSDGDDDDREINLNITVVNNVPPPPGPPQDEPPAPKRKHKDRSFQRGGGGKQQKPQKKMDDNELTESAPWMENAFLEMYQEMRELEKHHGVKIAVPEFLFFGFQSAGKTSTLSVVSGIPAGTMKDGTGTRCPVRYTMQHNPDLKKDKITVQGSPVRNYEEQVDRVCGHMRNLDQQGRFSADILEVKIESPNVPNMIFVDMPGMLRNDSDPKFAEWKRQLEMITCDLLSKIATDGVSYAFMPVFVKAAHEPEEQDLVYYVDDLLTSVRPKWKDDALFIVNKFDRLGNMDKGSELCKTLMFLGEHGETVFTITNPFGAATARMDAAELVAHIQSVPDQEAEWWDQMIYDLKKSNDRDVDKLNSIRQQVCGCNLMKEILKRRMIDIVKTTLPFMQTQLDRAQMEKEEAIAVLQQELQLGDPSKLKELVQRFNVRFLAMMKEFYGSRKHSNLKGIRRSWRGDMQDFHDNTKSHFTSKHAGRWEEDNYYIKPKDLRKLFVKVQRPDLAAQVDMKLTATAALKRALDFWVSMVSFMNFPLYNDTDILNMSVSFDGTIQSDPWETARNIVFHASDHLRRATIWLAEYLRYRLKTNAEIIYKAAIEEFDNTGHYERRDILRSHENPLADGSEKKEKKKEDKILKLLKLGKNDYDKVIDHLVEEFIDTIEKIPNDMTETVDKKFVSTAMRFSTALNKLWDYAVNYRMDHSERLQFNHEGISGGHGKPTQQGIPKVNAQPLPPPDQGGQQVTTTVQVTVTTDGGQNGKKRKKSRRHDADDQGTSKYVQEEAKMDDSMRPQQTQDEIARPAGTRDTFFYKTLFPPKNDFAFPMHYENDVDLIYNLARVQWAAVKNHTIGTVTQQMGHRIMKDVTLLGDDQHFNNAMLRGWDRPQIQKLINELTKRTNIPSSQFELIINKAPIPAQKAVQQMSDDEILAFYGAELKSKQELLEKMLTEYREFLDRKYIAEMKIEEMRNQDFEK